MKHVVAVHVTGNNDKFYLGQQGLTRFKHEATPHGSFTAAAFAGMYATREALAEGREISAHVVTH